MMVDFKDFVYKNGNYFVIKTGNTLTKRSLKVNEDLISDFPDSIDLKITNQCSCGCPFCHENSVPNGKSYNFDNTIKILSQLPKLPIELAIGGGNVLEIPDKTIKLLEWCNEYGFRTRITVNKNDLTFNKDLVKTNILNNIYNHVSTIGISISDEKFLNEIILNNPTYTYFDNLWLYNKVYHIISGVFPTNKVYDLINSGKKILILGYKQWGRGINYKHGNLLEFEIEVKKAILDARRFGKPITVGFDNLALNQLHIRDSFSENEWSQLYFGDEGKHSMYIDAVEETFAKTSRDSKRYSWNDYSLIDCFNILKND